MWPELVFTSSRYNFKECKFQDHEYCVLRETNFLWQTSFYHSQTWFTTLYKNSQLGCLALQIICFWGIICPQFVWFQHSKMVSRSLHFNMLLSNHSCHIQVTYNHSPPCWDIALMESVDGQTDADNFNAPNWTKGKNETFTIFSSNCLNYFVYSSTNMISKYVDYFFAENMCSIDNLEMSLLLETLYIILICIFKLYAFQWCINCFLMFNHEQTSYCIYQDILH